MYDYSPSYVVVFERRDGQPDEEYYYNSEYEAEEHFQMFNDPDDEVNAKLYVCITLKEVDWLNRRDDEIDSIYFQTGD